MFPGDTGVRTPAFSDSFPSFVVVCGLHKEIELINCVNNEYRREKNKPVIE